MEYFGEVFSSCFGSIFKLPTGKGITYPPVSDELLVWLKGNNDPAGELKLDSWAKPDKENWAMSKSHCVALNGVDEFGTLDRAITLAGDFEDISFDVERTSLSSTTEGLLGDEGANNNYITIRSTSAIMVKIDGNSVTFYNSKILVGHSKVKISRSGIDVTVEVNGVPETKAMNGGDFIVFRVGVRATAEFAGKMYNIHLKDATQDIHFRMAEGTGLICFSDDYENDGYYITLTGVPANIWGQRQDSYHGNAVEGFGYRENLQRYSEKLDESSAWRVNGVSVLDEGDGWYLVSKTTTGNSAAISTESPTTATVTEYSFLLKLRAGDNSSNVELGMYTGVATILSGPGSVSDHGGTAVISGLSQVEETVALVTKSNFVVGTTALKVYVYPDGYSSTTIGNDVRVKQIQLFQGVSSTEYAETKDFTLSGQEYLPFLNDEKGGTFNGCETSYAPKEFPVGTSDGSDIITFTDDHGAIVSHGSLDTSTPSYTHPTLSMTAGTLRDILFEDGTLVQLREGEGTDIHDTEGNIVGTLTATLPTFWEGAPMVAQSIIDAEEAADAYYLTDGAGHGIEKTQQEWMTDGVMNKNGKYFFSGVLPWTVDSECEKPELKIYKESLSDAEDVLVKRGDLCGSFKDCDDAMLIGTAGTIYGYTASFGDLYIKEFEGGLISEIYADTADDSVTLTMNSGFTPEHPYLRLGIGGNLVILTYDAPTHTYTGTDATLTAYLSGNVGGSTCINLTGTA